MMPETPLPAARPALPLAEILGLGLVATVLVMVPGGALENERHDLPKELLVHLLALCAAGAALARARRVRLAGEDVSLAVFLALGLVSSAAAAVNPWMAARSSALACSAAAVFWAVRAAGGRGRRRLLALAAAAVTVAAAAALLEAYGVVEGLSTANRAPGGTLGHRNRLAHLLVLGLPLLAVQVAGARGRARLLGWNAGMVAVGAALALSRSRAAWVATAVVVALALLSAALAGPGARRALPARRLGLSVLALLLGAALAVALPNRLRWNSYTPYRDSLATLVDHREGSGRGRVIQYANTLRRAADQPLLGVGPGNWTVRYPSYASPGDPSYIPTNRFPTGRYPQGDWVALLAERGAAAALAAALAAAILLLRCAATVRGGRGPRALRAAAALCAGAALAVLGTFDAVLMTPAAALLAAVALGALAPRAPAARRRPLPRVASRMTLAASAAVLCGAVLLGAVQLRAATLYGSSPVAENLARAVRLYPGDHYAQLRLGEALAERGECAEALPPLRAASRLFPTAPLAERLRRRCQSRMARAHGAAGALRRSGSPR
ncbi:MAG: tetratricopeptide repeat protein [Longimicrobiaceae bacterium]